MNYPVNQFILGSTDPMLSSIGDLDMQIQKSEAYIKKLQEFKRQQTSKLIWDCIDEEVSPLSDIQRTRLFNTPEYKKNANIIQNMVDTEILNLVKARIESTPQGKEILQKQLDTVHKLKNSIVEETNKEMEIFNSFKEFSKTNPNVTYEEFVKNNIYDK